MEFEFSEELRTDCAIDPAQLDIEALKQSDLSIKWAERAIGAKAEVETLEHRVKTLEARLNLDVRERPEDFGLKTVTEPAVKAAVISAEQMIKLTTEYFRKRHQLAFLDRATREMESRQAMLKELVKLHGQQYFAGPDVPRDLVSAYQAHRNRAENVGLARMTTRKRVKEKK